jgi:hypothetical protein
MLNEITSTIVALMIIFSGIFAFKYFYGNVQCNSYAELTDRKVKFSVFNGCFVEFNGKYIPRSEIEKRFIMSNDK